MDAYENVIVDAITKIKLAYGIQRNWEGDPCLPQAYSWAGLIAAMIVLTHLE